MPLIYHYQSLFRQSLVSNHSNIPNNAHQYVFVSFKQSETYSDVRVAPPLIPFSYNKKVVCKYGLELTERIGPLGLDAWV